MAKATHQGHCQACGSLQKLPGGKLAKHGYTVEWSCFNGVCRGSGKLPFEQDYSLVQLFIDYANQQLDGIESAIAGLNRPAANLTAWAQIYIPGTYRIRGGYKWVKREVFESQRSADYYDGVVTTITVLTHDRASDPNNRKHYFAGETALDIATKMNQDYARRVLEPSANQLVDYIKWQHNRIIKWRPAELIPVDKR